MSGNGKVFSFGAQKEVGERGAEIFEAHYGEPIQRLKYDSPVGDYMTSDGRIIELKTDTYPLARTPNFFFEFHSNTTKKTFGGPWRAHHLGADLFVYLYLADRTWYEFSDLPALIRDTEELIRTAKLKPVTVPNRKFTTSGYKIPREDLCHLWKEVKAPAKGGQP